LPKATAQERKDVAHGAHSLIVCGLPSPDRWP